MPELLCMGLVRLKQACARAALIGIAIAVAYGIDRSSEGFPSNVVFGLAVVVIGAVAGGILSAVWRQQEGTD